MEIIEPRGFSQRLLPGVFRQVRSQLAPGDPQQVKATIEAQAEAAGADEVMVTTTVWDHQLRLRSYRLLAEAFGLAA